MYYVIKNGPNIQLGVDANGAIETIAGFTSGPTLKTRDLAILADEMVAVLNRDLVNRANDIAATPENIATSDKDWIQHAPPDWVKRNEHRKLWENVSSGCGDNTCTIHYPGEQEQGPQWCGNPECACGGVEDPTDPASTVKAPTTELGDNPGVPVGEDEIAYHVDNAFHPTDKDLGLEDVGP